jgi:hypothetical protein
MWQLTDLYCSISILLMKNFIIALTFCSLISVSTHLLADDVKSELPKVDIAQIDISKPGAIKSTLQLLTGRAVTLTVEQSAPISGIIEKVGSDTVKLKELTGKEYFSAVIRLSAVNAVSYRPR